MENNCLSMWATDTVKGRVQKNEKSQPFSCFQNLKIRCAVFSLWNILCVCSLFFLQTWAGGGESESQLESAERGNANVATCSPNTDMTSSSSNTLNFSLSLQTIPRGRNTKVKIWLWFLFYFYTLLKGVWHQSPLTSDLLQLHTERTRVTTSKECAKKENASNLYKVFVKINKSKANIYCVNAEASSQCK